MAEIDTAGFDQRQKLRGVDRRRAEGDPLHPQSRGFETPATARPRDPGRQAARPLPDTAPATRAPGPTGVSGGSTPVAIASERSSSAAGSGLGGRATPPAARRLASATASMISLSSTSTAKLGGEREHRGGAPAPRSARARAGAPPSADSALPASDARCARTATSTPTSVVCRRVVEAVGVVGRSRNERRGLRSGPAPRR